MFTLPHIDDLEKALEGDLTCTYHSGCGQCAYWMIRCRGCSDTGYLCIPHKDGWFTRLAEWIDVADYFHCVKCGFERQHWSEVMEVLPV